MGERGVHTRVVVYVAGLLVVVAVIGVVTWRLLGARSTYEDALATLPASTLRSAFTDWKVARENAGGQSLDDDSPPRRVAGFLSRAATRDLTSGSGVAAATDVLSRRFGFSGLDADWEMVGRTERAQVDVLKLDGVDMAAVERRLAELGYAAPPGGSGRGLAWTASEALVTRLNGTPAPLLRHIVVLPDQHLVLLSDSAAYVAGTARAARGSGGSLLGRGGVESLAEAADEPSAAVQWAGGYACRDLSMASATAQGRLVGRALVAKAGPVSPVAGMVLAQHADGSMVLGMRFPTAGEASRNLRSRLRLARGDAPGQGGSFRDRFRVASSDVDGRDLVLDLEPVPRRPVLSDLSSGPVLYAVC